MNKKTFWEGRPVYLLTISFIQVQAKPDGWLHLLVLALVGNVLVVLLMNNLIRFRPLQLHL